jgi:hypothetical protein
MIKKNSSLIDVNKCNVEWARIFDGWEIRSFVRAWIWIFS